MTLGNIKFIDYVNNCLQTYSDVVLCALRHGDKISNDTNKCMNVSWLFIDINT